MIRKDFSDLKPLLISNLPPVETIRNARLPEVYEAAKMAIIQCAQIDQCQDWADKAEALASYARQAEDESLRRMADRIQARAIFKCGQLLREIEKAQGARTDLEPQEGALQKLTQTQAAREAGLSEHQHKTAIRVSNIPEEEFHALVESEDPPTVTTLAEMGKHPRPKPLVDLGDITPDQYYEATKLMGLLRRFIEDIAAIDVRKALDGFKDFERQRVRENARACLDETNRLLTMMEEREKWQYSKE